MVYECKVPAIFRKKYNKSFLQPLRNLENESKRVFNNDIGML